MQHSKLLDHGSVQPRPRLTLLVVLFCKVEPKLPDGSTFDRQVTPRGERLPKLQRRAAQERVRRMAMREWLTS